MPCGNCNNRNYGNYITNSSYRLCGNRNTCQTRCLCRQLCDMSRLAPVGKPGPNNYRHGSIGYVGPTGQTGPTGSTGMSGPQGTTGAVGAPSSYNIFFSVYDVTTNNYLPVITWVPNDFAGNTFVDLLPYSQYTQLSTGNPVFIRSPSGSTVTYTGGTLTYLMSFSFDIATTVDSEPTINLTTGTVEFEGLNSNVTINFNTGSYIDSNLTQSYNGTFDTLISLTNGTAIKPKIHLDFVVGPEKTIFTELNYLSITFTEIRT